MPAILRFFRWLNFIMDVFLLNLSAILSYSIVLSHRPLLYRQGLPYLLIINFAWLFAQSFFNIYDDYIHRNSVSLFNRAIKAFFTFIMCIVIIFFVSMQNDTLDLRELTQIVFYGTMSVFFMLGLFFSRLVLLSFRKTARAKMDAYRRNIIIVGEDTQGGNFDSFLSDHVTAKYNVLGVFHDGDKTKQINAYLGTTADCIPFLKENKVDEIFCAVPGVSKEKVNLLMKAADRSLTRFRLIPNYMEYFTGNMAFEMVDNIPMLSNRTEPLENIQNAFMKRMFDFVFSSLVIVFVLSWLMPIIALIIKMDSKGPVFFRQLRSGRSNEPFFCLKFRSMTVNEDADSKQAQKNDMRITKVGAFLRKTSLDELPQFFNVFVGNMSVVGPRPHMLKHTEEYSQLIDKFMVRHFLKPGITGWAQVSGLRGETKTTNEMAQRVEADVYYLEHWSLIFDLKIIFLTVWNVVKGEENAY